MAYGLKIDNGNGKRVVDSDYTGVFYVGKSTISSPGTVQIPGYTNSTVPPLVFIKLPDGSGEFASVTELSYQAGTAPGGAASVSVTVPSNIVYAFAGVSENAGVTQSVCLANGGTFISTAVGGCRFTGTMQVKTDTYIRGNLAINQTDVAAISGRNNFDDSGVFGNSDYRLNDFSVTVNMPMTSGVVNTSGVTVANTGFGWTVNDTAYLGNDAVIDTAGSAFPQSLGWYPYNTSTGKWYTDGASHCQDCDDIDGTDAGFTDSNYMPEVTIDSLASGWTATIGGDFSSDVTVYFYGLGGNTPATNEHGLVIKDSGGDVAFSSFNYPPVIRGIDNISFTNLKYSTDHDSSPTAHSLDCNETLSYPKADTAVYSIPIAPTTEHGLEVAPLGGGAPPSLLTIRTAFMQSGLRFTTSGANVTGLTFQSKPTQTLINRGTDDCNASQGIYTGTCNAKSPLWTITSGNTNITTESHLICGASFTYSIPSWDVNNDCIFIDTSIPDTLTY